MTALKIAGAIFEVEDIYTEGHTLTANEANALNATRRENIRNNQAKHVTAGAKEGKDQDVLQEMITAYASIYEFGARAVRAAVDPVGRIALTLARAAVRKTLKEHDLTKNPDYNKDWVSNKAAEVVESNPYFREEATRQFEAQQAQASVDLGL